MKIIYVPQHVKIEYDYPYARVGNDTYNLNYYKIIRSLRVIKGGKDEGV
jgi:hypothetical protein